MKKCPICSGPLIKGCNRFTVPYKSEIKTIKNIKQYKCKPCREVFIDSETSIKIDKESVKDIKKEL